MYGSETVTNTDADYIWDRSNGNVYNQHSDLTATGIETRSKLQKILDRWQLIQTIDRLSIGHFVDSQLSALNAKADKNAHAGLHLIGDKVAFSISGLQFKHLLQFNLAGDGTIQCYPQDAVKGEKGYEFNATMPVGNDSLISIIIDQPSAKLIALLDRQRRCASAGEIAQALPALLAGKAYQIGRVDIFTGAKNAANK